jgi:hypothetical protein
MTTWIALGGPDHLATGDESTTVPEGYVLDGPGSSFGPTLPMEVRQADDVFRWEHDVMYLRDGRTLVENIRNGTIRFDAGPLGDATGPAIAQGTEALQVLLGVLYDSPDMEDAQMARDLVDTYRQRGLV